MMTTLGNIYVSECTPPSYIGANLAKSQYTAHGTQYTAGPGAQYSRHPWLLFGGSF